jgi:hypothetical protein
VHLCPDGWPGRAGRSLAGNTRFSIQYKQFNKRGYARKWCSSPSRHVLHVPSDGSSCLLRWLTQLSALPLLLVGVHGFSRGLPFICRRRIEWFKRGMTKLQNDSSRETREKSHRRLLW